MKGTARGERQPAVRAPPPSDAWPEGGGNKTEEIVEMSERVAKLVHSSPESALGACRLGAAWSKWRNEEQVQIPNTASRCRSPEAPRGLGTYCIRYLLVW